VSEKPKKNELFFGFPRKEEGGRRNEISTEIQF
jgi:hypothetical protein